MSYWIPEKYSGFIKPKYPEMADSTRRIEMDRIVGRICGDYLSKSKMQKKN